MAERKQFGKGKDILIRVIWDFIYFLTSSERFMLLLFQRYFRETHVKSDVNDEDGILI